MKITFFILLVTIFCFSNEFLFSASSISFAEKNLSPSNPVATSKLILGNPSDATADENNPNNYLVIHENFILSYNRQRGAANWACWHLSASDIGDFRTNAFAPDSLLPADFRIKPNELVEKGYDRGHLCPSEDRSSLEDNNRETFLMSNMAAQTSKLNRGTWKSLEGYEQKLAQQGNEEYIYAGCYGDQGRIKNKITIPTNCYKIIVVLPEGNNDLKRINKSTRVIAVDMPNTKTVKKGWRNYRTTVDDLEEETGYDFLSALPEDVQTTIEKRKDNN